MINPADVQRAYTENLDFSGLLANMEAQRQKNEQLNYLRQQKADTDFYNFNKYIEDKHNIGTGTPLDRITNDAINKAKTALYEGLQKNKGRLSTAQMMQLTSPYLSGLQAKQQAAKLIRADLEKRRTTFDKDYPYLDWNKFEPEALKRVFYDENGSIKNEIDPEGFSKFYSQVLSSPDEMAKFANQDQLPSYLTKNINERFPVNEQRFLVNGKPGVNAIYDVMGVRPYETYNPKNRQAEVASMPVLVDDKIINILPDNQYNQIFNQPAFKIAQSQIKERLKDNEYFKKLSPQEQDQAAGYEVLKGIGLSSGKTVPRLDKSEWEMYRQQVNDVRSAHHQQVMEGIAGEHLNLARQRQRNQTANVGQTFVDIMAGKPEALKKASYTTISPKADFSMATDPSAPRKVPAIDMTALLPNGAIEANDGKGTRLKVYKDAVNGSIWVREQNPKKAKGSNKTIYEEGDWKEIKPSEVPNFLNTIESQLNKKVTDYDAEDYANSISSFE